MNKFLSGILIIASMATTMTTANHIPFDEEFRFSDDNPQFEGRRSHHASNMHFRGKKTSSSTKRSKQRFPLATRQHSPAYFDCLSTPSPSTERLSLATRTPTPYPTYSPVTPNEPYCLDVDKEVYDCGEPITVSFDVSRRENPETALIQDFIGIFPHYVSSYDVPEVWQWTCSPPPFVPDTCSNGPQYSGNVVFDGLPEYNLEPSAWPVSANYDPLELEVNRFFKVVLLRGDGTMYCVSKRFEILENSLPGCSIRVSSPSG
jgi:hypothetical protein